RVLQHIADPVPAVREMARVLCPGGELVAYDNDWETLTVDEGGSCTDTHRPECLVRLVSLGLDRSAAGPPVPAGRPRRRRRVPEDPGPARPGRCRSALLLLRVRRSPREGWGRRAGGRGPLVGGAARRRGR